ncbi:hypothetical protein HPB50_028296 [Hyalomma asiaticum]|nr:hypothetical protein HPB50_028296 [Hyalomma asiaticum]
MAADSADFQRLYTLSRVATNRQQFEAAVTATAAENPAATTSQGNIICFDEGGTTHEAHPPACSVFEGARHITPSPSPEFAESREPSRQTCSTHSAPAPDLTGQSDWSCVRAMDEFYRIADPSAPNCEKVERVMRQAHPTFAVYLRGSEFRDLDELASEAKRIQADILASRAYRDHHRQRRRHSSRDARGTETTFAPVHREMVCLPSVLNARAAVGSYLTGLLTRTLTLDEQHALPMAEDARAESAWTGALCRGERRSNGARHRTPSATAADKPLL